VKNDGLQLERLRKCDLCGSSSYLPFVGGKDILVGTNGYFEYVKCSMCGLVFLEPPSKEDILTKYPSSYYDGWKDKLSHRMLVILRKLSIGRSVPTAGGPVLDVGSGSGSFLRILKQLGVTAYGLEPSTAGYLVTKEKGLEVYRGTLFEAKFPHGHFQTIVLNHVLEHVESPTALLQELKRILHPDGLLLVGVPNIDSFHFKAMKGNWVGLDPPRHLFQFSPKTLKLYGAKVGLKVERVRYNSAALPFIVYLYVLARRILPFERPLNETVVDNPLLQILFSPFAIMLNLLHWGDKVEAFMTPHQSDPS
jgi:SAM-dependent methyltransferase